LGFKGGYRPWGSKGATALGVQRGLSPLGFKGGSRPLVWGLGIEDPQNLSLTPSPLGRVGEGLKSPTLGGYYVPTFTKGT